MHELSIAMSVLDLVEEESSRRNNAAVKAVHIKLGPLSGVIKQALCSAYEMAREGTTLADCELIVEDVPIVVHCAICQSDCPPESIQSICCSRCGAADVAVISGRELEVTAMEIES